MGETTIGVLSDVASATWDILTIVVVIMCAICMAALALLYVIDQSKYIKDKDSEINRLRNNVKNLERSRANGYKKNLETSDATDKIFAMYLAQKETAEANEIRFAEWDAKQVKRIKALETQLRENGIEPVKWEEIKNVA